MKFQQFQLIVFGFSLAISLANGTSLATSVLRHLDQQLDQEWNNFKQTFDRSYNLDEEEEQQRKAIFAQNLQLIREHNQKYDAGQSSYQLGVNQFADWTREEFRTLVTSSKPLPRRIHSSTQQKPILDTTNIDDLPEEVDWTKKGVVTPVQSMGNCADGYAFGPVATVETAHALKTGKLVELSVQQVVDCSYPQGNHDCQGGLIDFTMDYIKKYGLDTQQSYPYVANNSDQGCATGNKPIAATIRDYVDLPRFDEQSMQAAVAKLGPVAISLDADSPHFMLYKSGVYDYQDCNMVWIDHGMAVVGYGTLNGKKYWKLKNSMGTTWGQQGYLLIARDANNLCGVASTPCYPVV